MEKLKSRKFWMAVVAAALIVTNEGLGLDIPADTVLAFAAVVIGYIFGEAYVDSNRMM